jgi:hypothetical protein
MKTQATNPDTKAWNFAQWTSMNHNYTKPEHPTQRGFVFSSRVSNATRTKEAHHEA